VHLVEPFPPDGRSSLENYRAIRRELELYSPDLAAKPEILAVSKSELTGADEVQAELSRELVREVLAISAATGQGLAQLVQRVTAALAEIPKVAAPLPVLAVLPRVTTGAEP
jgi:GTP-binding protein